MKVAEKQALRRREIVKAVRDILSTTTIDNLTVDDICDANGIAKGTFYHYFTSKEQLLNEIVCYPIDDFFDSQKDAFLSRSSFEDAIVLYAKTYAVYISTTGMDMCKNVLLSLISNNNTNFVDRNRAVNRVLMEIIEHWKAKGTITGKLSEEEMQDLFVITCRGYILSCYSERNFENIEKRLTMHMRMLARELTVRTS